MVCISTVKSSGVLFRLKVSALNPAHTACCHRLCRSGLGWRPAPLSWWALPARVARGGHPHLRGACRRGRDGGAARLATQRRMCHCLGATGGSPDLLGVGPVWVRRCRGVWQARRLLVEPRGWQQARALREYQVSTLAVAGCSFGYFCAPGSPASPLSWTLCDCDELLYSPPLFARSPARPSVATLEQLYNHKQSEPSLDRRSPRSDVRPSAPLPPEASARPGTAP